ASRSAISGSVGSAAMRALSRLYELRPCTRSYQLITMLSKSRYTATRPSEASVTPSSLRWRPARRRRLARVGDAQHAPDLVERAHDPHGLVEGEDLAVGASLGHEALCLERLELHAPPLVLRREALEHRAVGRREGER